eukprot:3510522-Alexandrium_andersonii.AAC.1
MGRAGVRRSCRSASGRRRSRTVPLIEMAASKASARDMVSTAKVLRQTRSHVCDFQSRRLAVRRCPSLADLWVRRMT